MFEIITITVADDEDGEAVDRGDEILSALENADLGFAFEVKREMKAAL